MAFSIILNIVQLVLFRKWLKYLTETTGKGGNVTELDKEIIRVLKDEKDVSDVADILGSSGHGIKKTKGMYSSHCISFHSIISHGNPISILII